MFDRLGLAFALWLSFVAGVLTLIGMTTLFAIEQSSSVRNSLPPFPLNREP
jgi:hypothetical protein